MRLVPYLLLFLVFGCCAPNSVFPDVYVISDPANMDPNGGTAVPYKVILDYTYLITAYHVVKDSPPQTIAGKTVEVIKFNETLDIAVIRIKKVLPILPLDREPPVRHEPVMAFGCPKNLDSVVTRGFVAQKEGPNGWVCSAPAAPGSSGGLVWSEGRQKVIGITRAIAIHGFNLITHIHYFVPTSDICVWLDKEGLL